MNENIDLTKILKDCPKGTKLYSIAYGDVEFEEIAESKEYPIYIRVDDYHIGSLTANGQIYANTNGECALFPSKDQRDWSKFSAPWLEKQGKEGYALKSFKDEDVRKFMRYIEKQAKAYEFNLPNRGYDIYAFAKDLLVWLEKQGEDKEEINNFDVRPGLYKCVHRMFDGTPDGKLLFEIGNVYKCISKHDRAEFEASYGHSIYLEDPVVRKHFIPFESKNEQASSQPNERAWLYLVSDVLTWKDGIGQYLDDPRVQELAKLLCSKYEQKLYKPSVLSNPTNTVKNEQKSADKKEYILCAAIKRKTPINVKSKNYKTNTLDDDIYSIEIGRRHNDIMARFGKDVLCLTQQGFYTSFGRFVSREEALQIAKDAGQVEEPSFGKLYSFDKLYSEDLY